MDNGRRLTVRQIAGAMARRIVTYACKNERADIDDHLGFIKFGSRVDLYLPLDSEILVRIGDEVSGGVTPVAIVGRRKNFDEEHIDMNAIVKNIPNGITCLNLVAGVMAVICAFGGRDALWGLDGFAWAWIFIGIAAVADFLDGFAARTLHTYSSPERNLTRSAIL